MNETVLSKGELTKIRIRAAARELYKEYGYVKTSMQMIADKCGIQKSLLLYHFPQKSIILNQVIGSVIKQINDFVKSYAGDDMFLEWMLTQRLYHDVTYKNERSMRLHEEAILRMQNESFIYEDYDDIFLRIIEQYNLPISQRMLSIKKLQFTGIYAILMTANKNHILETTDEERYYEMVYTTGAILGISMRSIISTYERMLELIEIIEKTPEYDTFYLLE